MSHRTFHSFTLQTNKQGHLCPSVRFVVGENELAYWSFSLLSQIFPAERFPWALNQQSIINEGLEEMNKTTELTECRCFGLFFFLRSEKKNPSSCQHIENFRTSERDMPLNLPRSAGDSLRYLGVQVYLCVYIWAECLNSSSQQRYGP